MVDCLKLKVVLQKYDVGQNYFVPHVCTILQISHQMHQCDVLLQQYKISILKIQSGK